MTQRARIRICGVVVGLILPERFPLERAYDGRFHPALVSLVASA